MFAIMTYILMPYLFSCFLGLGLLVWFRPQCLKEWYLVPWLSAFYGQALLILIGAYLFCFNVYMGYLVVIASSAGILLLLIAYMHRRAELLEIIADWLIALKNLISMEGIILVVGIAVLAAPVLKAGMPTSPFRFGPDIAQYGVMSQYLLDGGTYGHLVDLQISENPSAVILCESFLHGFRWGYLFVLTAFCKLMGCVHTYQMAFLMLLASYAMSCVFVFHIIRRFAGISSKLSFWMSVAFALNGNLIFLYYESFWAQIFAMPAMILLFTFIIELRNDMVDSAKWRELLPAGIWIACVLLLSYNEMIVFLFPTMLMALLVADLCIDKRLPRYYLSFYGLICLGACVIAWPVLQLFYAAIFKGAYGVGGGGGAWPQPMWAMPSEIFGFTSIYGKLHNIAMPLPFEVPVSRTVIDIALNIIVSGFLVLCFFLNLYRNKKIDRNMLLVAVFFILLVFITRKLFHQHAYLYVKIYTLMLPVLFIGLAGIFSKGNDHVLSARWRSVASILFVSVVALSGIMTIFKYSLVSKYMSRDLIGLHDFVGRKSLLPNADGSDRNFFVGISLTDKKMALSKVVQNDLSIAFIVMRANFHILYRPAQLPPQHMADIALNPSGGMSPFLSYNALFVLERKELADFGMKINPERQIIYTNDRFVVVDSGLSLSGFIRSGNGLAQATFGHVMI